MMMTRSNFVSLVASPKPNTNFKEESFAYRGVEAWNSLSKSNQINFVNEGKRMTVKTDNPAALQRFKVG